ncbi:MAG: FtsX-like permease family protein [Acidimicrobiales bacterium]
MLILRDLQYRKWRVLVVAVLMAVVLTLLFIMSGLVGQFRYEPVSATLRAGGSANWVVSESSTGPLTSPTALSVEMMAGIEGEPVLIGMGSLDGLRSAVIGRSYGSGEPTLIDGRYPESEAELVIDDSAGYRVGETVDLGAEQATVVGLTEGATILAGVPMSFATLGYAQEVVASGRPVVTGVLTPDPATSPPAGLKLMSADDVAADGLVPLENAIGSVSLVRALLWLITLIIIAAVIYITALERTRDFAVLKAVGANNRSLGLSLVVQGVIMAVVATLLAAVLQNFVTPLFPMTVRVTGSIFWQILIGSVVVALVAGVAGASRVSNTAPAEAFG